MNDMRMKEILMITRPITPPWDEGSKNIAWQIARFSKQHYYHILTTKNTRLHQGIHNIKLWEIYSSDHLNFTQKIKLLWFLITSSFPEINIIHTLFTPTLKTSFVLSKIPHLSNKTFIQTVPSLVDDLTPKLAQRLYPSDKVVVLSDWTANILSKFGVSRIERINIGVNIDRFSPCNDKHYLRKMNGVGHEGPTVLFSGELTRLGSRTMLLEIADNVFQYSDNIHFIFASPTRSQRDIVARKDMITKIKTRGFSDKVHVLGDVDNFPELLKMCDVFIYPVSTMKGKIDTPLTVLEAMATGLPIIFSDLAPLNEISKDAIGVAVKPEENDTFVQSIIELAQNKKRRQEMGLRGRNVIKKYYSLRQMVKAYEDLYNES